MSLIDSLRRLVDPIAHRAVVEERRRKTATPVSARAPQLTCRVCGHEGEARFCPRCLADTMGPPRRR